jgi:hypothetical protein
VIGDAKVEFNAAVRECLANCYRTDLPVAALAEYVEVLKQRDWTPAEIHRVEAAVLKILLAVVSKDERDDLVNRIIKPRESRSAAAGDSSDGKGGASSKRDRKPALPNKGGGKRIDPSGKGSGSVLPARDLFSAEGDAANRT